MQETLNSKTPTSITGVPVGVVYGVFLVSGVSALIYQLVWQRSLLTIYGSNIESVAMVVSAFLVGLGIGSILGGIVSKKPSRPLLLIFACVEILIGAYGLVSLRLFDMVGRNTTGGATLETGLWCFSLILVPTLLMGSTLPLLVAHQVNTSRNVGHSVSMLYFVNTLGAAIGAFLAAFVILGCLGLQGSVAVAVILNFLVGGVMFVAWYRRRKQVA